ncbi:putative cyclase [Mycena sanguinolenta]|uniref:Putative cyclase n=1 Tax=Mycena sanguinolenta TaxID=230812 RepID=A0A8H6Y2X1_9AGAR|nr:putative cyclase [Mycena sanguinolenta]
MQVVDLSHSLKEGMQIYPGDPIFSSSCALTIEKDGWAVLSLSMGSHTGTHVDAPSHYIADGKTIEQIPLSTFIGRALVIPLTHKSAREVITWADVAPYASQMAEGVIVLLHTGWSQYWGTEKSIEHPFLDRTAAEQIIATGVQVVGIDALSPDATLLEGTGSFGAHEVILGAGCVIAENLTNLHALEGSNYTVHLMPLKIDGSDGSPVRAFALETPT